MVIIRTQAGCAATEGMMEQRIERFSTEVRRELVALARLGVRVSKKAFRATEDETLMTKYFTMSAGECADLLRELYP